MSTATIFEIQQNIARYGLSAIVIFGNFGNLFTILTLVKSLKRRLNSCSLYLLAASISNWIIINTAVVSNIIGVDHVDPQNSSNFICKLRWSTVHALLMLSRSFMIAACIDRWALCSRNITIRSFARPHNAFRVIIFLLIFWTIIPIHLAVFFNNHSGRCQAQSGAYAFFYAIYSLIIIGILPFVLMILFSLLASYNLQSTRRRVLPIEQTFRNIKIHKRDRDLMRMLTGEVIAYCITTIPYPISVIYSVSTSSMTASKSPMRLAIESLISYIISPFLNLMYCCVQFYVYTLCSQKFRQEFLDLFRGRLGMIRNHEHINIHPTLHRTIEL